MSLPLFHSKGFDISEGSGPHVDFCKFEADDFDFCIIRSSIGMRVDAEFVSNVKRARTTKMALGAYHAFIDTDDVEAQATFYRKLSEDNGLCSIDLPSLIPFNDFEKVWGPSYVEATKKAYDFQRMIEKLWGLQIGDSFFYSYPYFIDALPDIDEKKGLGVRKLAIANYGALSPRVPKPWTDWTLWQSRGDILVHGSIVDLDFYNGPKESLPLLKGSES